jgi:hypothetical protein
MFAGTSSRGGPTSRCPVAGDREEPSSVDRERAGRDAPAARVPYREFPPALGAPVLGPPPLAGLRALMGLPILAGPPALAGPPLAGPPRGVLRPSLRAPKARPSPARALSARTPPAPSEPAVPGWRGPPGPTRRLAPAGRPVLSRQAPCSDPLACPVVRKPPARPLGRSALARGAPAPGPPAREPPVRDLPVRGTPVRGTPVREPPADAADESRAASLRSASLGRRPERGLSRRESAPARRELAWPETGPL